MTTLPPVKYVDHDADMADVIDACRTSPVLSIDTEFARFNTYYPMVGLIQIYNGECCYLIDPLEIEDLSPLKSLLTDESILKVFHACSEDMEVFQYCLGAVPQPVFDSQIGAAALGVGFSLSYQAMVSHYLNIEVPKEETRSDWLQRPLTKEQLDYAVLDVVYLLEVYKLQREALESMGRLEWVVEEANRSSEDLPIMVKPEDAYLKAKGLSALNRKQLAVLQSLYTWREQVAREQNVPRNRVVDPRGLMAIAKEPLVNRQSLQAIADLSPRQVRKFGDDLMFLAAEARQIPESQCPERVTGDGKPIDNKLLKLLRKTAERAAEEHGIAPELLVKRRDLERLIRSEDEAGNFHLPAELMGWRKDIVGDELVRALQS